MTELRDYQKRTLSPADRISTSAAMERLQQTEWRIGVQGGEVTMTDGGVVIVVMTPEEARDLAVALLLKSREAEQS